LFDGCLCTLIKERGLYSEFRKKITENIIDALDSSVYPGLRENILFTDYSSPATLQRMFGVTDGAVVGWSLEDPVPVPDHLSRIKSAIHTPVPAVFQAGQWTYSPAGVPVAVLTGRIAAQEINARF
jgi:phytoene dehydrogenase-like protein